MTKTTDLDFSCEHEHRGMWISRIKATVWPGEPAVLNDRPCKMVCDEDPGEIQDIQAFGDDGIEIEFEDGNVPEEIEDMVWNEFARGLE